MNNKIKPYGKAYTDNDIPVFGAYILTSDGPIEKYPSRVPTPTRTRKTHNKLVEQVEQLIKQTVKQETDIYERQNNKRDINGT